MAVSHLDRLSATDASFLSQENETSHMHIGAVLVFEGPPPSYDEFLEHVEARLHLVPRYRQKLAFPPLQSGRPFWVDDPRLNLEYHVRHSSLPEPGDDDQLAQLTARLFSQQLDRSKPLWEMYLVQGLEGNRFALISKTHHALVDGVSGVDLGTVLYDANPVPVGLAGPVRPWEPHPEPSDAEMVARGVQGLAKLPLGIGKRALKTVRHPRYTANRLAETAEGVGEVAWELMNPAPKLPLNSDIGRTAVTAGCTPTCPTSRSSRTPSAARSTTSCWPWSRAGCRPGCAPAAFAPRASRLRGSCRSACAATRSGA